MIDPLVRRAEAHDVATLRHLEHDARAAVAVVRGGRRWLDGHPAVDERWGAAIELRAVWVATIAASPAEPATPEAVVGFLVADLVHDPMAVARIDQVYVDVDARELGFGDALVAAAMAWGRDVGAELIEAETLPGDRNLKNLYERAGVTARLITVSKPLASPPPDVPPPRVSHF